MIFFVIKRNQGDQKWARQLLKKENSYVTGNVSSASVLIDKKFSQNEHFCTTFLTVFTAVPDRLKELFVSYRKDFAVH